MAEQVHRIGYLSHGPSPDPKALQGGGRGCRPAKDNRRYFEGVMWLPRTGARWRHLPDEYSKWNSVFRRYRRWLEVGVFDAMLQTLAEMVSERLGTACSGA